MAFPIALVVGAAVSAIGSKIAADQANQASAQAASGNAAGNAAGFNPEAETNKWVNNMRSLNGEPAGMPPPMGMGGSSQIPGSAGVKMGDQSFLSPGSQSHMADIAMSGDPSGSVMDGGGSGGGGGEGGGFNMDSALQYAALAAQLGSMFAPPPPPAAPRGGGGGGGFHPKPFTMQMLNGGR